MVFLSFCSFQVLPTYFLSESTHFLSLVRKPTGISGLIIKYNTIRQTKNKLECDKDPNKERKARDKAQETQTDAETHTFTHIEIPQNPQTGSHNNFETTSKNAVGLVLWPTLKSGLFPL